MKKEKTNLQKMSRMISLMLILAALPFGVLLLNKKVSQLRLVASSEDGPSVNVTTFDYDLSEASAHEFKKAFKYQVLKEASVLKTPQGPAMRLGLFLMKNAAGGKVFACEQYPTIDLLFAAEGIAFSGEIPQMILRVPCTVATDQRHIDTLPIPFSKILKSPVTQYEFTTQAENSREQGKVYFRHVVEFWPTEWTWTGVKFYAEDPGDTLQINGYEVISVLGEPLVIKATE
ncbi:MAG: hypothetical protein OM95_14495 [Bdellovibrio sp. ArHS]|uniref:hypothetical protein n=1 Tax=Bdellovibrio sp. ArHS TaxID=1569284 RepID=UPI000582BB0C|nr:hypothetical protein [Bdellovibrio sp. ArHS]KHD87398.1 MAG: hypothetical protein OM95_14495 [Bdellovibrio sp. ArHS]